MRSTPRYLIQRGEYGAARAQVSQNLTTSKRDRQYLLDRMKLAILATADGYPEAAQLTFEQVYEILRTQGINKDRTVQSVVFYEGVKIWKGEPFEQALGMFYYGVQQGMLGHWDNARAASGSSLFQLRDFRTDRERNDPNAQPIDTEDVARRALVHERRAAGVATDEENDFFNTGYALHDSNFTLGYILNAIANQQLGREQEANDNLAVAVRINPNLRPLMQAIRAGQYNTVLIVSFGQGPAKVAYGPDNALARFVPVTSSDERPLLVRVLPGGAGSGETGPGRAYPVALDVNRMAMDHMWNNLEDVRTAKSLIGTGLVGAGAMTTVAGAHHDSGAAVIAGLGMMAVGALMKIGSHADTRYCDVMPQRYYIVPLNITDPQTRIELQVEMAPASRLVIAGLGPPTDPRQAQLRYLHLVSPTYSGTNHPPQWAVSGEIFYDNDYTRASAADGLEGQSPDLPYILGGRSVAAPTERAMDRYQDGGYLQGYTTAELRSLYYDEGIRWEVQDETGRLDKHVLEGGKSMVAPLPGTVGFARLFGTVRPAYQPSSRRVRQTAAAVRAEAGQSAATAPVGQQAVSD